MLTQLPSIYKIVGITIYTQFQLLMHERVLKSSVPSGNISLATAIVLLLNLVD